MKRFSLYIVIGVLVILGVIWSCSLSFNDTQYTVTITDKERVNKGDSSKYLVYCEDKEGNSLVFENTDCALRWKWNSSNVQGELKVGSTYTITVVGVRIPIFSSYQNIISVEDAGEKE